MNPVPRRPARVLAALGSTLLLQACCSLGQPIDASWYYLPEGDRVVVGLRNRSAKELTIDSLTLDRALSVKAGAIPQKLPPRALELFTVDFDRCQCNLPRFVEITASCDGRSFEQRIEFADRMPADLPPWIRSRACIHPAPNAKFVQPTGACTK